MRLVVVVALALCCVACDSGASRAHTAITTTTTSPAPACGTPSSFSAAHEVHVSAGGGEIWGLAMGPGAIPPRVGDEIKIVWRVTGRGPLRVAFVAPDGAARPLVFGPERHGSSTYRRPGDEWGTGFRFDRAGCWHIHLARSGTQGDVWLIAT